MFHLICVASKNFSVLWWASSIARAVAGVSHFVAEFSINVRQTNLKHSTRKHGLRKATASFVVQESWPFHSFRSRPAASWMPVAHSREGLGLIGFPLFVIAWFGLVPDKISLVN